MALELCVKGSNDHKKAGSELGDCPASQRIVMILGLKGIHYQIKYVDLNKKGDYKKLPVLKHVKNGLEREIDNSDAIEEYIEENFPDPNLKISTGSKANEAGQDLYSKFAKFMRNSNPKIDAKLRDDLNKELQKLNEFLKPGAYLDGEKLKLPDCNLLPKLMHVKEAGELKGFAISKDYGNVLEYLKQATRQKVFSDTFTDQVKEDIKVGWIKKMGN